MKGLWLTICLLGGALLLGCALLVPAHFRAVDAAAVEGAGQKLANGTTLIGEGLTFVSVEKVGPAQMLLRVAQSESVPKSDMLARSVAQFAQENPSLVALGGATPLLEKTDLAPNAKEPQPIVEILARRAAREKILALLQQSRRPGVQQILKNRELKNTVHFPGAMTSSGQALDAAILSAALLYQGDYFAPSFRDAFEGLVMLANRGQSSDSLELVYLDLLSLGKRLDWVSLTELIKQVNDLNTLRELAEAMRSNEEASANIYSAAILSGNASGVAKYLTKFSETGLNDLNFALRNGRGAVELLVKEQQRIYYGGVRGKIVGYDPFGAFFYALVPASVASRAGALLIKYSLLLLAAFCIARLIGTITTPIGHRLGLRLAGDSIFTLALVFVIAVAVEPFIGQPSQHNPFPIRIQIPNLAAAAGIQLSPLTPNFMNTLSLVSLITFFSVQAIIYVWCLSRIARIRRESVPASMKLRLIENEDLLFDAGLYVGFVGSVLSLILMSIGIGKISMMAYASTAFGIIFVSVLKIFHVRPFRRQLILESEVQS
jgi:hypothetical protein